MFTLALQHSSIGKEVSDGFRESNERLEYLGDAILGAIVAEFLFKRFPYKDEGFLTEIRSRFVSREALNLLAKKIGLDQLVEYDAKRRNSLSFKYVYGDAMEAFVGAVYLDRGFIFCRDFVINKLLFTHFDIDNVVQNNHNYKSQLIELCQKNNRQVRFDTVEDEEGGNQKQFIVQVIIDDVVIAVGRGFSKKKAEQDAARRAYEAEQQ